MFLQLKEIQATRADETMASQRLQGLGDVLQSKLAEMESLQAQLEGAQSILREEKGERWKVDGKRMEICLIIFVNFALGRSPTTPCSQLWSGQRSARKN